MMSYDCLQNNYHDSLVECRLYYEHLVHDLQKVGVG
jgi:hypothetical protein